MRIKKYQVPIEESEITNQPSLSLEQCKAVMNQRGLVYTDEEILIIRDFLYRMAAMTTHHYYYHRINNTKIIPLEQNHDHETESILLHSRKHRRAG